MPNNPLEGISDERREMQADLRLLRLLRHADQLADEPTTKELVGDRIPGSKSLDEEKPR
ncbi:hypothetical protein ABT373_15355 [Streptomyces sp. NPDC000070]|uniref:hypothetical protein n=1 Tax=Streptomyces sp. NPDC000070 TaxID=3154240 RepID=UPI003317EF93